MKCKGQNKDGTPCSRNVSGESEYCYQHTKGVWNKITYTIADIIGVKRRFLLWVLLFSLGVFFIQTHLSYQYDQILDNLKLKPDIEIEVSPFLYSATFGEYLPLIVTNTGDYTLEDVHVFINSCEMPNNYSEHYKLPLLPAHSERVVPFGNKGVIESFKKGNCYPFAGKERSYPSFIFSRRRIQAGENYTATSTGCGSCLFDAKVFATIVEKNTTYNKNISSYFDFPVDLQFTISNS